MDGQAIRAADQRIRAAPLRAERRHHQDGNHDDQRDKNSPPIRAQRVYFMVASTATVGARHLMLCIASPTDKSLPLYDEGKVDTVPPYSSKTIQGHRALARISVTRCIVKPPQELFI
jgi:hypothetical protein